MHFSLAVVALVAALVGGRNFAQAKPVAQPDLQHEARQAATLPASWTVTTTLPGAETQVAEVDEMEMPLASEADRVTREAVEGAFIVELKENVQASTDFIAHLEAQLPGIKASIRTNLTGSIFNGMSLQLEGADMAAAAEKLQDLAEVESVSPMHQWSTPKIKMSNPWGVNVNISLPSNLSRRQIPIARAGDPYHVDTQVNKMHAAGFTGKGIKAAIIGTMIDETHPYLKVSFSRSWLQPDDNYDCPPDKIEHETACAGILAMKPTPLGYVGVAPDVTLGSYRIVGCKYGGTDEKLLKAMQAAVDDGVHILSYSMSIAEPFTTLALNKAMNAAVERGVFFSGGMGNKGSKGVSAIGSPASALNVFTSGASERRFGVVHANRSTWTVDGNAQDFAWRQGRAPGLTDWDSVKLPLYINMGAKGGAQPGGCEELPSNTPDLSKHIVLMRRPGCSYIDLAAYAARAGAKYIIIADDNVEGRITRADITAGGVTALASVNLQAAEAWTAAIKAGKKVTLDMRPGEFPIALSEGWRNRDKVAGLSSWGPTADGFGAAAILSPGHQSFTVVPPGTGELWTTASGTSFSAPYTAGVAALVAQASGKGDWKSLYSRLANTGKPVPRDNNWKEDPDLELASTAQQGGGLIQAYDAAFAPAIIEKTRLDFRDTPRRQEQSFTITSVAKTAITYRLSNLAAGTVYAILEGSTAPASSTDMQTKQYVRGVTAELTFSQSTFALQPGASATIRVTASDPQGVDGSRMPIFSGWVVLAGSDGSELKVAYLGIAGDLDDVPRLQSIIIRMTDPNAQPGEEPRPIVDPNRAIKLPEEEIILHNTYGIPTRKTRFWIVDQATGREVGRANVGDGGRAHTSLLSSWKGNRADGMPTLTTGSYRLVGKVLTLFGDESNPAHWVKQAESNVFRVA